LNSRVRLSGIYDYTTTITYSHARQPVGVIRGVDELGWGDGAAVPLQLSPSGGKINIQINKKKIYCSPQILNY